MVPYQGPGQHLRDCRMVFFFFAKDEQYQRDNAVTWLTAASGRKTASALHLSEYVSGLMAG